ncbi:tripartite tricarboxylate transporter substrate binding protein [Nocardioides sp. NPDC127503]|uniref:Bug family tripartite tricarboxylate transporter substrate binding protein n=1 Tax=Nocardioides sp. NPDC127503 TaxID=3154516 RepID=UPI00331CD47C
MKLVRIGVVGVFAAATVLSACTPQQGATESSESYPDKPIELVVPFDPGGGTDLTARVIAKAMSDELGVPVNVVNKPGAETIVGVDYVRKSAADGYTLLADGAASSSILSFGENVPFEWDERTFVGRVTSGPHAIAVDKDSPYKTLDDLLEALSKDPGSLHTAYSGGTTTSDLTNLSVLEEAGVSITDVKTVNYSSAGETMEGVAGGDIDYGVGGASAAFALASSGDIRVLAQTGSEPLEQLPDAPTTDEAGHPDINLAYWVGISGPVDLPEDVQNRLADVISKIVEDPAVVDSLANVGVVADPITLGDFSDYVDSEVETFADLRKRVGN